MLGASTSNGVYVAESDRPVESAAAMVVEADIPCRKCAYNLRGISTAGQCPECGTNVVVSVRGHLIRYCDPRWVAGLSKGVRLILWALLLAIVCAPAGAVLHIAAPGPTDRILNGLGQTVVDLLFFWGSWLLSEPDPSTLGEVEYGAARRALRVTVLIGVVWWVLNLGQQASFFPPAVVRIVAGTANALSLADVIGWFVQLHYLQHLMLRIPEPNLSQRAGFLKYAIGVSDAALVLVNAVPAVGSCASGIAAICMVIFGIMYLDVLVKLNRRLKVDRAAAEILWSQRKTRVP
jgi:hypothetical protein